MSFNAAETSHNQHKLVDNTSEQSQDDVKMSNNLRTISKIPTNQLVDEIKEIDNDESPNRKNQKKNEAKAFHMGFQPPESAQEHYFTMDSTRRKGFEGNGPNNPSFDHTQYMD